MYDHVSIPYRVHAIWNSRWYGYRNSQTLFQFLIGFMQCWSLPSRRQSSKVCYVSIPYRVHAITDLTRVCLLFRPSIADFLGFFKVFPFDLFLGNGFMAGFWRIWKTLKIIERILTSKRPLLTTNFRSTPSSCGIFRYQLLSPWDNDGFGTVSPPLIIRPSSKMLEIGNRANTVRIKLSGGLFTPLVHCTIGTLMENKNRAWNNVSQTPSYSKNC